MFCVYNKAQASLQGLQCRDPQCLEISAICMVEAIFLPWSVIEAQTRANDHSILILTAVWFINYVNWTGNSNLANVGHTSNCPIHLSAAMGKESKKARATWHTAIGMTDKCWKKLKERLLPHYHTAIGIRQHLQLRLLWDWRQRMRQVSMQLGLSSCLLSKHQIFMLWWQAGEKKVLHNEAKKQTEQVMS